MSYDDFKRNHDAFLIEQLEGSIVQFGHPFTGELLDGCVWRVIREDEKNFSVVLRFVQKV